MKYTSRKLIVTVYAMLLSLLFAMLSIPDGNLTVVLLSGIASYTVSNAWASSKNNESSGFASRKFVITMSGMTLAALTTYFGIMTAGLSNVLLAAIASYNLTNAWLVEPEFETNDS